MKLKLQNQSKINKKSQKRNIKKMINKNNYWKKKLDYKKMFYSKIHKNYLN